MGPIMADFAEAMSHGSFPGDVDAKAGAPS